MKKQRNQSTIEILKQMPFVIFIKDIGKKTEDRTLLKIQISKGLIIKRLSINKLFKLLDEQQEFEYIVEMVE